MARPKRKPTAFIGLGRTLSGKIISGNKPARPRKGHTPTRHGAAQVEVGKKFESDISDNGKDPDFILEEEIDLDSQTDSDNVGLAKEGSALTAGHVKRKNPKGKTEMGQFNTARIPSEQNVLVADGVPQDSQSNMIRRQTQESVIFRRINATGGYPEDPMVSTEETARLGDRFEDVDRGQHTNDSPAEGNTNKKRPRGLTPDQPSKLRRINQCKLQDETAGKTRSGRKFKATRGRTLGENERGKL